MSGVIWAFHPNLPNPDYLSFGFDKVYFEDIGVNSVMNRFELLETLERWWGGNWPDAPSYKKGKFKIFIGELSNYEYYECEKSRLQRNDRRTYFVHNWNITEQNIYDLYENRIFI